MSDRSWVHRRGDLARDGWETVVDGGIPGWRHTGLRIAELAGGDRAELPAGAVERIVVPLTGPVEVEHRDAAGQTGRTSLDGRPSVFSGPTDVLYLGAGASAVLRGSGRVAVAEAPTEEVHPVRRIAAADTPVELRGAGRSSRQVHNFGTPEALAAGRLIACEVVTPAGNWSSYPPHKHDVEEPGVETALEEIYYFETAPVTGAPDDAAPFALFSTSSSPAGRLDLDVRVGSGDVVLVPYGYHGPAAAPPGYDLYYLNVMAGPGRTRAWLIQDDPRHGWVRDSWADETMDPRLPYGRAREEGRR